MIGSGTAATTRRPADPDAARHGWLIEATADPALASRDRGVGSDAATWDRFILRLTAVGYRCIALDLRGHASSARTADYSLGCIRDDVLGLLEALALRNVTLIGHSVGGYAALAAALHTPERIARLVLEDLTAAIPHARLT